MVPAFKGLVRTPEDKRDRAVIDASMQRANARALILERARAASSSPAVS